MLLRERTFLQDICRWTVKTRQFGTAARQLPIERCRLKERKTEGSSGQIQGRLSVRELDVVEAMVGEGAFPEVVNSEQTVEVWVPSIMLPTWASKVGEKLKGKGEGKGKVSKKESENAVEVGHESDGVHGLESFDPTGDVLADLAQLDTPFGIEGTTMPEAKHGKYLGVVDLTGGEGMGIKRGGDADRGEGPSKKKRQVEEGEKGEVVDLTDDI
jgi:hypothetical protein